MADGDVTPKDDIVTDFFSDPPQDNKDQGDKSGQDAGDQGGRDGGKPADNKDDKGGEGKEEKINVDEIVKKTTESVLAKVEPLIKSSSTNTSRQREFDKWLSSEDGKLFKPYAEFLEKAASDPRYANLSISQLPGAIMKPTAYAKVLTDAKTAADKAAADSKAGGSSGRATGGEEGDAPDYKNMSREDFKKEMDANRAKIKRR